VGRAGISFTCYDSHLFPEDEAYEILEGDLFAVPVPDAAHQTATHKLARSLRRRVETMNYGRIFHAPYRVVLSKTTMVQPDILFVGIARLGITGEKKLVGAPDLIIEVISEGDDKRGLAVKRRLYANHQVPEYWVVCPQERTVEVLLWSEVGYICFRRWAAFERLSTPLLPRLSLPLDCIFPSRPERSCTGQAIL
jgi:Uma2 family endonuclease